jgi:predicted acetyltransferase
VLVPVSESSAIAASPDELAPSAQRVGATELRTVQPASSEFRRWLDIVADAYPIMKLSTAEQRDARWEEERKLAPRQPEQRVVGAFRDGVLVGGMRLYDLRMCVRGAQVFSGGVGSVAVGLAHKRHGIARDLVRGFLLEYRERGAAMAVLYAFRPNFYGKLGFGHGAKLNQYAVPLTTLPDDGLRERVRALGPPDAEAFLETYNRVQARTNGLLRRERWRAELRLEQPQFRSFGFFDGATLAGYLSVEFRLGKSDTMNRNDLFVHELIYETPAALRALLAFARSQSDQFAKLIVNTQDPDFHFSLDDPRDGSDRSLFPPVYHTTNTQGLGPMYRAVDGAALLQALGGCRFGDLDAVVRIALADPFFAPLAGTRAVRFEQGQPAAVDASTPADVDLAIDVADFSALVMGSVRLRSLVAYGRAVLSKPDWLRRLDAAFDAEPPQCLTRF